VLTECTFFDEEHRDRARIGRHLHLRDLGVLLEAWKAKHIVLLHVSRRTSIESARELMIKFLGPEQASRVHLLMDHRENRERICLQRAGDSDSMVDASNVDA
jgi:ribonuclease Z